MSSTPPTPAEEVALGQLAVELGLIQPRQLAEALRSPAGTHGHTPLGARLLMQGWIDDPGLQRLMLEFTRRHRRPPMTADAPGAHALFGAVVPRLPGNEEPTILNMDAESVRTAAAGLTAPPPGPPARRAAAESAPDAAGAGRRVIEDRFEVIDQVGRGGMGVVYKARDLTDGKTVALKMLVNREAAAASIKRFLREAKAVMKLEHPSIVQVYHIGEVDGMPYYAMEYVEGESFGASVERGKVDLLVVARIARDVARALGVAHRAGIVHRDIKPDNILMDREGIPKLADFGLAKDAGAATQLTMRGNALGTPIYMPPEQATGQLDLVDGRSDLYSLGATMYEAATGQVPFRGDDPFKIMENVVNLPLTPPSRFRPGLQDLEFIILKAMEKNKRNRYPDADAMADDLDRYLAGKSVLARPASRAARAWAELLTNRLLLITVGAFVIALVAATVILVVGRNASPR